MISLTAAGGADKGRRIIVTDAFPWKNFNSIKAEKQWWETMKNKSIVILPLMIPLGDFDPCDITTLTQENLAAEVDRALNTTGAKSWFGYLNMSPLMHPCFEPAA